VTRGRSPAPREFPLDCAWEPAAAPAQRWPGPLDRVPAGRLRERLRPVVGVRALLPLVGSAGVPHELPVRNADEKTVVRLTVYRSSETEPFARALPLLPVPALKLAGDVLPDGLAERSRRRVSALTGAAAA